LMPTIADAGNNLLAARNQMGFTLGFHIVLACFGVAFPLVMLTAEAYGHRKGDAAALRLARNWSKGVAVLFAVGAVTGTVLSFEFGLLWPRFMDRFGDAFGIAFGIEGIFFFLEAIFIAIYIYGWDRLSPRAHMLAAIPIVISGIGGAFSVIAANAWMNQPQGFDLDAAGNVTNVRPFEVLFNPATGYEFFHMWLAAYMVTGFLIASVYAVGMLRGRRDRYHRLGFVIPFTIAAIATPIQLFVGDTAARAVADDQPAKFAGFECIYKSGDDQAEHIGGICHDGKVSGGVSIPGLDSLLVGFSTGTYVKGLDQIPDDAEPPANTMLHLAFDTMVGVGTALFLLAVWFAITWWRRRDLPATPWFLRIAALAGVGAILALESGWIVTEVGRQPWIVYGFMRTSEAVTPAQGIWFVFALTMLLYVGLAVTAITVLRALSRRWREGVPEEGGEIPYGPPPGERSEASA
jgi:cytochrome bd ubiquinol oxidase subunit I